MGRPYHPDKGLNRLILLHVRRNPGAWPGTISRVLAYDNSTVREAVARLAEHGHLRLEDRDGHDWLYLTELGTAALRRRRATRGADPWKPTEAVHS